MLRLDEIFRKLGENRGILRGFGVKRLGLFGSIVRNEHGSDSDLDFVVELENVTFDAYMDLKFYLEDLFNRRVDLVLIDSIKPRLKPIILKEAVYATGL